MEPLTVYIRYPEDKHDSGEIQVSGLNADQLQRVVSDMISEAHAAYVLTGDPTFTTLKQAIDDANTIAHTERSKIGG